MLIFNNEIQLMEFLENIYQLAVSNNDINRNLTPNEVLERLREMVANGDHDE